MKRWREQKRDGKAADVAADVLGATLRYLSAVASTTTLGVQRPAAPDDTDHRLAFREEVISRWQAIEPTGSAFDAAWQFAEIYLPDDVDEFLGRVAQAASDIWISQMTALSFPPGRADDDFQKGFGSKPRERIQTLRAEARRLLRPHAQLMENARGERRRAALARSEEQARKLTMGSAGALPPDDDG